VGEEPRGYSTLSATLFVAETQSPFNGEYVAAESSGNAMVCPNTSRYGLSDCRQHKLSSILGAWDPLREEMTFLLIG